MARFDVQERPSLWNRRPNARPTLSPLLRDRPNVHEPKVPPFLSHKDRHQRARTESGESLAEAPFERCREIENAEVRAIERISLRCREQRIGIWPTYGIPFWPRPKHSPVSHLFPGIRPPTSNASSIVTASIRVIRWHHSGRVNSTVGNRGVSTRENNGTDRPILRSLECSRSRRNHGVFHRRRDLSGPHHGRTHQRLRHRRDGE